MSTPFDQDENNNNGNVGLAFALSIGAAVSTSLGACVVFFPVLLNMISRKKMAASFGFSGGIMLFISLVSLLPRAIKKIDIDQYDKNNAFLYASLSFFFGASLPLIINFFVKILLHNNNDKSEASNNHKGNVKRKKVTKTKQKFRSGAIRIRNKKTPIVPCCQQENAVDLEECKEIIENDKNTLEGNDQQEEVFQVVDENDNADNEEEGNVSEEAEDTSEDDSSINEGDCTVDSFDSEEQRQLHLVNVKLAIAFALHNLPEGIVTYSTSANESKVGALLSIAVALHNIPEGFCIALSAYFSSRSRTRAFLWGSLPGLFEPLGALIGWAVLANTELSYLAQGIIDGVVAGIIAMICLKELFTSAHKYDPGDKVATLSIFSGMLVMAIGTFASELSHKA